MNTFYYVCTLILDSGNIDTCIGCKEVCNKPDDVMVSFRSYDLYIDWFGSLEDARAYAEYMRDPRNSTMTAYIKKA